jgi:hypothetical protein
MEYDIVKWGEICTKLYVWDYTDNFSYLSIPFPDFYSIHENNNWFYQHNVRGAFNNADSEENGEFGEMKAYLLAKLMSDPYMTEEQYYTHMDEFLEGYYGENWREVRKVIDLLLEKTAKLDLCVFDTEDQYSLHLRRDIDGLYETFENIKMKSENYAEMQRIDRSEMQFEFMWLNKYFNNEYKSGDEARKNAIVEKCYAFIEKMKYYKIRYNEWIGYDLDFPEIAVPPNEWAYL